MKDAAGNWIEKYNNSTFFPDSWTEQKILDEISYAFNNKEFLEGSTNTWKEQVLKELR